MKTCQSCGAANPDEAAQCQRCARSLSEPVLVATPPLTPPNRVTIVDFDMPFGSMVGFMVKWAIATIPALLFLAIVGFFVFAFLAALAA